MARRREAKSVKFQIMLSPSDKARIEDLSEQTGSTMAELIRQMIISYHTMKTQGEPICATGTRCYCPHVHPPLLQSTYKPPTDPTSGEPA